MNRKHHRVIALATSMILVLATVLMSSLAAIAADTPNVAIMTAVATVPVGIGPDKIVVDTTVEGRTPDGPQSLSVAPNGRIYLLDSAQSQVLVVDKDGAIEKTIAVPFTEYPRDLVVAKNRLFILDSNAVVYETSMDGELITTHRLPEDMGSMSVYRLAESHGDIVLWAENYVEIPLSSMPRSANLSEKAKKPEGRGVKNKDGRSFVGKVVDLHGGEVYSLDGSVNIPIVTQQAFGSVMITAFDNASNLYAVVEELADPAPVVSTEITIRRYDRHGVQTGVAKLSGQDFAAYPNRPVDVTPNGDVYVMVPSATQVTVYRVELGREYVSDLPAVQSRLASLYAEQAEAQVMATWIGSPLPRATTRSRSYQMADYSWTWSPTKFDYFSNGNARPANAYRPTQLSASSSSSQVGIPYTWGGWDTPWSHSDGQPWSDWGASLTYYSTKGPLVGNTGTTWYSGTSGVDCSGFVSAAVWTYSFSGTKPGTSHLSADGTTVSNTVGNNGSFSSYSGLQPMDFFVNSGHVFEYDRRKLDGTGIETVESTTSKANVSGDVFEGAKRYWRRWTDASSYTHKTWWTKQTGDDFNLPYTSTGSYTSIKGQGQYFRFTYSGGSSATVSATITASSGDPDIYIYSSAYGLITKSEIYGSDTASWTATPGATYYVLVHTWSDASYSISKSW